MARILITGALLAAAVALSGCDGGDSNDASTGSNAPGSSHASGTTSRSTDAPNGQAAGGLPINPDGTLNLRKLTAESAPAACTYLFGKVADMQRLLGVPLDPRSDKKVLGEWGFVSSGFKETGDLRCLVKWSMNQDRGGEAMFNISRTADQPSPTAAHAQRFAKNATMIVQFYPLADDEASLIKASDSSLDDVLRKALSKIAPV